MTFGSIYAIIIGVNIGDCVTTAIVCSIGAKADTKRTGLVHVIFNLLALVLIVVGVNVFHAVGWLDGIWNETITSGGIANAHTLFRLASAVLLLPFENVFEKLACRLVKPDKVVGHSVDAELEQLDEKLFSSPALALSSISNVIAAMIHLAEINLHAAMQCIRKYSPEAIEEIHANESRLDAMTDKLELYLLHMAPGIPKGEIYNKVSYYTQCLSDIERIGDHAVNLADTATELHVSNTSLSANAQSELDIIFDAVKKNIANASLAVSGFDFDAARRIEPLEEVVDDLVALLRKNHIQRLHAGTCTTQSGICFLDILSNLERISDQCSNLALFTLSVENPQIMTSLHDYARYLHSGKDTFFNETYEADHKDYFGRFNGI